MDCRHFDVLNDLCAVLARTFGHGQRDVRGVRLTVAGQINRARQIVGVKMRIAVFDVREADLLDIDPKGAGHGGLTADFLKARVGLGHRNGAHGAKAGRNLGFFLQITQQALGVFRKLGHGGGGAQLCDEPGRMPCRAGGQFLAFQQDHLIPAQFGKVIGNRAADNAAADDDATGGCGQVCHMSSSFAKS